VTVGVNVGGNVVWVLWVGMCVVKTNEKEKSLSLSLLQKSTLQFKPISLHLIVEFNRLNKRVQHIQSARNAANLRR